MTSGERNPRGSDGRPARGCQSLQPTGSIRDSSTTPIPSVWSQRSKPRGNKAEYPPGGRPSSASGAIHPPSAVNSSGVPLCTSTRELRSASELVSATYRTTQDKWAGPSVFPAGNSGGASTGWLYSPPVTQNPSPRRTGMSSDLSPPARTWDGSSYPPVFEDWSGRPDLNRRPRAPKARALARLRHAPTVPPETAIIRAGGAAGKV